MASKILKRVGVGFIVPLVIGIVAAQLLGGLFFHNPFGYWEYRFRYTTPDAFQNVGKFWTYRPNAEIREITYFKRPFGDTFETSDCRYQSDDAGFLDNDGHAGTYDILLLGDSHAAGQGGCSWMAKLRAEVPGVSIYNASLMSTGVQNWAAFYDYLVEKGYRFNHVIILFIADDFFRPLRDMGQRELRCLHDSETCSARNDYYPLVPSLDLAATSKERSRIQGLGGEVTLLMKRHVWVPYLVVTQLGQLVAGRAPVVSEPTDAALDHIMDAVGSVRFVGINTKDEAALGTKDAASAVVGSYLDTRHISYDECVLRYDEFGAYDAHPTSQGYAHLSQCVAAAARRLEPR